MTARTAFVRTASAHDLPAISALLTRMSHNTNDGLLEPGKIARRAADWHSVEALRRQLDEPQSEFIVADDGAEIVGVGFARLVDERTSQLLQLYVDPVGQGVGNGRELLAELLGAFPTARSMTLDVDAANGRAIGFYSAHGFMEVERGIIDGVETLTMRRDLD